MVEMGCKKEMTSTTCKMMWKMGPGGSGLNLASQQRRHLHEQ
jgi:hypothetical protein